MFVVVDYLPVALTYGVVIDFALGALDYLRLSWDFDNEKTKGLTRELMWVICRSCGEG